MITAWLFFSKHNGPKHSHGDEVYGSAIVEPLFFELVASVSFADRSFILHLP